MCDNPEDPEDEGEPEPHDPPSAPDMHDEPKFCDASHEHKANAETQDRRKIENMPHNIS